MMKLKPFFILLCFLNLVLQASFAQVQADFAVDNTSGCSPLVVSFTNNSTGDNLTYSWDFGNSNSSTTKDPQATYTNPGTYTVKLAVSNGSATDEATATITVYKNPVADFEGDTKGCTPLTSQFLDKSTEGDAPINEWKWDFRSGFIDSRQNPTHTYTSEGQFDVYLEVTDENGCSHNIEKQAFVDVAQPPTSIFSYSPTVACEVPVEVNFNNASTGKGDITYEWNFGDGSTSNEISPNHTYSGFGSYVIRLNVATDYGCSTQTEKLFKAQNINAAGSLQQNGHSIASGDNICPGDVDFKSSTGAGINVMWDFGDGSFGYDTAGIHHYAAGGTYHVKLIAAPNEACADTLNWTIHVDDVNADFSFSPEYSCKSPVEVQFTNTSTDAVSFHWKFHDNTTSDAENPVKEYVVPSRTNKYANNEAHILNTSLTIENENGCQSTVTKSLTIKKPTAQLKADTLQGCIPLSVNFTDHSQSEQDITQWEWIFGDGTVNDGTNTEASHVYNTAGEYEARLVITNQEGCSDTSAAVMIEVGDELNPDFQIVPAVFCQNEIIRFSNPNQLDERIDQWHYSIGATEIPLDPAGSDTSWYVKLQETGNLDAQLTVNYNGCISEINKPGYVTANGPVANLSYSMECSSPYQFDFEGVVKNYDSYTWNFGDGNSNNAELTPSHTYSTEGDYTLNIIAVKGSCSDTAKSTISVREPLAKISGDTAVCAGDSVTLNGSASYNLVNYCYEKYQWHFNDSTRPVRTNKDTIDHVFQRPGMYEVMLVTRYDNKCTDTARQNIAVYQPVVGFSTDFSEGCAPLTIAFNDTSSGNEHALESWHIDFADDIDSSYYHQQETFFHTYYNVGTYPVTLSVTDTFGCSASYTHIINAANPSAEFTPLTSTETCAGDEMFFSHYYREGDSVRWKFGDGVFSTDTSETISHQYTEAGNYQVSLIVYQYACTDTFTTEPDLIQIQKANADFAVSDSFFNCYPELVEYTHNGTTPENVALGSWNFGFKNSTSEYAVTRQFTYPVPGEYTVSLNVETSFGCQDKKSRKIVVTGPRGNFTMSADAICRGEEVMLSLTDTADVYSFEWDLGDGNFVTGNPVRHKYYEMGDNIPKLILKGDSGRCLPPPVEDTLYVYELAADFAIENPAFCEQSDIIFSNQSIGQSESQWIINDVLSGSTENFSSEFTPGNYTADLVVANPQGCADTAEQTFAIHPLPSVWVMPDTFICAGKSVQLKASGGDAIEWFPAEGLSNSGSYEVEITPSVTTSYLARVTDTLTRCTNQDNVLITVQQPPNVQVSPEDTSIIIGEEIIIFADSLSGVQYAWTPENEVSCVNCASAVVMPKQSTTFILLVNDDKNCFQVTKTIPVEVIEEYSVDLPNSFTPNGDGNNDVVYVRGWGIKRLVEFRILNRWGNEVFFTDNLSQGWDGSFKGKLQNIDTYIYIVQVETWEGNLITKKGTLTLLK